MRMAGSWVQNGCGVFRVTRFVGDSGVCAGFVLPGRTPNFLLHSRGNHGILIELLLKGRPNDGFIAQIANFLGVAPVALTDTLRL
jgi:hypothetical protein